MNDWSHLPLVKPANLVVIGLTGNIACGKSTVLGMVHQLGAFTLDADQVTRQIQQPGTPTYQRIVEIFGEDILLAPAGPIDRRKLGAIVFQDAERLKQLEALVHPVVRSEINAWLAHVAQSHPLPPAASTSEASPPPLRPVAVIDAIKLLECGWKAYCDRVWVVVCPPSLQWERLTRGRGWSEEEARLRIAAQPPQEYRLPYADVIIDTAGSLASTYAQVEAAWNSLTPMRQS